MKSEIMGKFTKSTIITFISRILQLLLGIGTSVIIARALGPQRKGVYSLAILLPSLLITFTNFGVGQASVYYVGKKKYLMKEIFGNSIILSFLISIFTVIIGLFVILFLADKVFPGVERQYLFLALTLIPFQLFLSFVVNILLGLQKIKKYNFIALLYGFVFLFLITVFILGLHLGIKATIIAGIISYFIVGIILFLQTKKETGGLTLFFNKNISKDFFSYGIKVYLGNIFSFLHYKVDIFMLNIFLNPIAVGFYSVAAGAAEQIWIVSQSAGTVLLPRVSSETNKENLNKFTALVCRNILFITTLFAIFLFVIGHWLIILLYSEQFSDAILPFEILLIGAVTIGGWRILANDLYGRGKPILNTYISGISVIINVVLNLILIPKFGIAGAAWATVISYTIALIIIIIVYSKISGNKIVDVIFIQKSDLTFYKNFILNLSQKFRKILVF